MQYCVSLTLAQAAIGLIIDASGTDAPLSEAVTLPGAAYLDAFLFERELELIFQALWVGVGHASELRSPGRFITVDFGRESLILAADETAQRRAFHNTCRHRGTRLADSPCASDSKRIVCPYHAWAYALDGRLVRAPQMDQRANFDAAALPLSPVALEDFHGLQFINLGQDPDSLSNTLATFPDISGWNVANLVRRAERRYEVAANWKLIVENYSECYHCQLVHPQLHELSGRYVPGQATVEGPMHNGGPMALREGVKTLTPSGTSARATFPTLNAEQRRSVHYFHIYPNTLLGLHPDYVMVHYVWPRSANRTVVQTEWLFDANAVSDPTFDAGDAVEFWDTTNLQDWGLCERAQLGVCSSGHQPGPYQASEECVHLFDRWYVRHMGLTNK